MTDCTTVNREGTKVIILCFINIAKKQKKEGGVKMKKEIELNGLVYLVYDNGDIYGPERGKLKQRLNSDGYPIITVGKMDNRKSIRVHRIVAELFVDKPNCDSPLEVNHIDYNRSNNHYTNLEWVSHIDNVLWSSQNTDKYSVSHMGEKNGRSILLEQDVRDIRNMLNDGMSVSEIARRYGRGWQTINHIKYGNTWKNI